MSRIISNLSISKSAEKDIISYNLLGNFGTIYVRTFNNCKKFEYLLNALWSIQCQNNFFPG